MFVNLGASESSVRRVKVVEHRCQNWRMIIKKNKLKIIEEILNLLSFIDFPESKSSCPNFHFFPEQKEVLKAFKLTQIWKLKYSSETQMEIQFEID